MNDGKNAYPYAVKYNAEFDRVTNIFIFRN